MTQMGKPGQPAATISRAFDEFLGDQKSRISPKTFSKYQSIIGLYKSYLESYWPGHDGEYATITKKGGIYCGTFGPGDATLGFGEFLGYPTRAELADALRRLLRANIPLEGAADHGVSEALYLRDPDDNGVELYWDRPQDQWPRAADGSVRMYTHPLDLQSLLAAAAPESVTGPTSTG
jgi:hypothetical protein